MKPSEKRLEGLYFYSLIKTAVIVLFLFALTAFARQDPLHGQHLVKPFKLIANIYYVGFSENTSWLITTPQGNILLDPTYDSFVPYVAKNIEDLGFKVKDTKIILQAHAHPDNIEGLARFKELTGAKVLVMAEDAEVVADGGKSDFRSDGTQQWKPVRPDQLLHDEEKVQLGGVALIAHMTAGHTKGCTTWSTIAEENGQKYNVLFICGLNLNDGVPLVGNKKYPAIAEDYKKSFSLLKTLPCDVFFVSHTQWFNFDEKLKRMQEGAAPNPFIDPQGYKAYLQGREVAFLTQLRKEQGGSR